MATGSEILEQILARARAQLEQKAQATVSSAQVAQPAATTPLIPVDLPKGVSNAEIRLEEIPSAPPAPRPSVEETIVPVVAPPVETALPAAAATHEASVPNIILYESQDAPPPLALDPGSRARASIQKILDEYAPYLPARDDGQGSFQVTRENGQPPKILRDGKDGESLDLQTSVRMMSLITSISGILTAESITEFSANFTINPVARAMELICAQETLNHLKFILASIHPSVLLHVKKILQDDGVLLRRFGVSWETNIKSVSAIDPGEVAPARVIVPLARIAPQPPKIVDLESARDLIRTLEPLFPTGVVTVVVSASGVRFLNSQGIEVSNKGSTYTLHSVDERVPLGEHNKDVIDPLKRYIENTCSQFPVRVEHLSPANIISKMNAGRESIDALLGIFVTMPRDTQIYLKDSPSSTSEAHNWFRSRLAHAFEQAESERKEQSGWRSTSLPTGPNGRIRLGLVSFGSLPEGVSAAVTFGAAQLGGFSSLPPSREAIIRGILEILKPEEEQVRATIVSALDAIANITPTEDRYYTAHTPNIDRGDDESVADSLARALPKATDVKAGPEDSTWADWIGRLTVAANAKGIFASRTEQGPLPVPAGTQQPKGVGNRRIST